MLIVINGASGAGKTFLLRQLDRFEYPKFVPFKKYTTRSPRDFEKRFESVDLIFNCDKNFVNNLEYSYEYKNELYGISKNELNNVIARGEVPVLIIRSFDIIQKIKMDFKEVCVFFVIGATGETLQKQLLNQRRASLDIESADQGFRLLTEEYVEQISLVDYCIINSLYDQEIYLKQFLSFTKEKFNLKDI